MVETDRVGSSIQQAERFMDGLGMIRDGTFQSSEFYWSITGKLEGFVVRARVSMRLVSMRATVIMIEMMYCGRVFDVIALDTRNNIEPTKTHIDNAIVGLTALVYGKEER